VTVTWASAVRWVKVFSFPLKNFCKILEIMSICVTIMPYGFCIGVLGLIMRHVRTVDRFLLLGVLLLAFGLRVLWVAEANIWWDEGWTVLLMRESVGSIVEMTSMDTHPPFYFWLSHGIWLLIGESEFAVRFLSVAAGTLTVAVLWRLGRLLWPGSRWVPLVAALLLSTSRFAIWWSQEGRMYGLSGLLITLSLLFTVQLRWQPTRKAALGYLLAMLAALHTLYLLAFALVVQGLYWLWTLIYEETWSARAQLVAKWALLQMVVLAGFAPWLMYAISRMNSWSAQEAFDVSLYFGLYANLLVLGIPTHVEAYRVPVLLVMGLLALVMLLWRIATPYPLIKQPAVLKWQNAGVALLLLALIVPPLVVWAITTLPHTFGHSPKPAARYLLPYTPAFYLLLAWAMAVLGAWAKRAQRTVQGGLLLAFLLLSGWSLSEYYQERYLLDDYKSLTLTIKAHHQAHDGVLLHTDDPWPIFNYHWPNKWVGTPHLQDADRAGADYFLSPLWDKHEALWLVINEDALRVDPQHEFERWLSERALGQQEWRFGSKRLLLFAKTSARADQLLALAPDFELPAQPTAFTSTPLPQEVPLAGWEQALNKVQAGDLLHTAAYIKPNNEGGSVELWLADFPHQRTSATYPPNANLTRVPLTLPIPPEAHNQSTSLMLNIAGTQIMLRPIYLIGNTPPPVTLTVTPQHAISATFGEPPFVELLGYDIAYPTQEHILLTLYWKTIRTPTQSYKIFTHLTQPDGFVVAQRDNLPMQGERPTTTWRQAELIVDPYHIPITDAPQGAYTLVIGFYDATTGIRLGPVKNGTGDVMANDQMRLGAVEVVK